MKLERAMSSYLRRHRVPALVQVHMADDVMSGAASLLQATGLGPVFPNTVVLGKSDDPDHAEGFVRLIQLASQLRRNLVILHEDEDPGERSTAPTLLVWWGGRQQNAGLLLALGYLLLNSPEWEDASLQLNTIVFDEAERAGALQRLNAFIQHGRLRAEPSVVVAERHELFDVIRRESASAELALLGLRSFRDGETASEYAEYFTDLLRKTDGLKRVAYVHAAEDIDFQRIWE